MKVILYQDVKHLGEMGDVKTVANGYARNYLLPRMLAVPYNEGTVAYFESRKEEIEARKEQKRKDSMSLKEKLEGLEIALAMPAGNNGKLYGAVTSQTVAEYLNNNGFEIERKKVEIQGLAIKSVGTYHATIHLYEAQTAEVKIVVTAQEDKSSEPKEERKPRAKKAEEDASQEAKATETTENAEATEAAPSTEETTSDAE